MSLSPDEFRTLANADGPLPAVLDVPCAPGPFDVIIRPPGSKSLTNRAALLAGLALGTSELAGALVDADDAKVMLSALESLGAKVEVRRETVRITGVAGRWRIAPGAEVRLDLHNAGTATRFLSAAALLAPHGTSIVIDGDARMRERPIGELVSALNALTDPHPCVEFLGKEDYPPLRVRPDRSATASGMHQVFGRTQSSQFVSAVLMLGAFLPHGIQVSFSTDDVTSRSYIAMTLGLLKRLGVPVSGSINDALGVRVGPGPVKAEAPTLRAFKLDIEPDASGATYPLAAAALVPGARVRVPGLDPRTSLQGDAGFVNVLGAFGCQVSTAGGYVSVTGPRALRSVDADLSDMPDTAMTAAVLACFAKEPGPHGDRASILRGLRTLRVKETDRLAALKTELEKLGARVEIFQETRRGHPDEGLKITPSAADQPRASVIEFDTYRDHRMAMSLALAGLVLPGVRVRDPACVDKTYRAFWRDLAKVYT